MFASDRRSVRNLSDNQSFHSEAAQVQLLCQWRVVDIDDASIVFGFSLFTSPFSDRPVSAPVIVSDCIFKL